ncbi:hypothetical protein FM037_13395 [Shewanella psychropiezotolerans]|uniref:Uncharacterized protein n=1 Tax=Shewanella psychropiezotolerans TaxID=2593655 RepID=A0ABX5X0U4_9GAMM|nr:hypothetical protein [Shewanella psychropiezotolerans]QDO84052.1 hypothetical protein FM037_13395 [Shewanella psychropiezotolerans]
MTKTTLEAQRFTINHEASKVRKSPKPKTEGERKINKTRRSIEERLEQKQLMHELGLTEEDISIL